MVVFVNVITPQGLEPLQFPTKFRSPSLQILVAGEGPDFIQAETRLLGGFDRRRDTGVSEAMWSDVFPAACPIVSNDAVDRP